MGEHKNIGINRFPKQSDWVGKDVEVRFDYGTSKKLYGKVVRDDMESPGETIIEIEYELSYGKRYIRATECQCSIKEEKQTVEFLETPLHGAIPLYAIVLKINEIIKRINALDKVDLEDIEAIARVAAMAEVVKREDMKHGCFLDTYFPKKEA